MEKVKPWLGEPQNTIAILQKYGFVFQKKYWSEFSDRSTVLDKIVAAAGIGPDDFVVEIGPWYRYSDAVSCVCCAECVCGGN